MRKSYLALLGVVVVMSLVAASWQGSSSQVLAKEPPVGKVNTAHKAKPCPEFEIDFKKEWEIVIRDHPLVADALLTSYAMNAKLIYHGDKLSTIDLSDLHELLQHRLCILGILDCTCVCPPDEEDDDFLKPCLPCKLPCGKWGEPDYMKCREEQIKCLASK